MVLQKLALAAAIAAAAGALALAPQANAATTGTITILGSVSAPTCTVAGGTGTAGGANPTVTLSQTTTQALNATAGTAVNAKPFSLALSGCPTAGGFTGVDVVLTSTAFDSTTGDLSNTGTASGVQIQVSNNSPGVTNGAAGSGSATGVINFKTPANNSQNVEFGSTAATVYDVNYSAAYVSPAGNATGGTVTSTATYTLAYH